MNRTIIPAIAALLLLTMAACHKIKNITDYNAWLNDPGNGCLQSRHLGGMEITAKYLPISYVAMKDRQTGGGQLNYDSMRASQQGQVTFLMSIQPEKQGTERHTGPVAYEGVHNYKEYAERLLSMNFFMDQHVKMYIDDSAYAPGIAIAENLYELSDGKNFMIVFAPGTNRVSKAKEILFVYDDPFFSLGKVQFRFSPHALEKADNLDTDG